ncbi:MAG: hypothetical protein CMI15_12915 [Opitutaceae bacterium]|nr:hypothetical protein [Opitutaceae bacterium]
MKSWPIVIVSALAVVFAAYAGYLSMENSRLKAMLAEIPKDEKTAAVDDIAEAAEEVIERAEEIEQPRRRPEFAEFENMSPEERREAIAERRRAARAAQLERALAAFDDPELRMDMIERQMERLDRGYAEFFRRLGLPPEEIDALKTLMAERNLIRMESSMRASAVTDEERAAIREDYRNQFAALSEDIDALLGEEDAQKLKQYSNTLQYRDDVEDFERALSYSETPLSKRQAEGLVNVYAKVDKDFEYTVDISQFQGRGRGRDSAPLTQELVDTYYQEREIYDAMLLEQAATVLNEAQLASLAAQQISEREREQRQAQLALENANVSDVPGGGFPRGGFGGGRGGPGGFGGGRGGR